MDKKIVIITGGNAGIGKASAMLLVRQGCHVIIACRNPDKGAEAVKKIKQRSQSGHIELMIVDMSLQASITEFANNFNQKYDRLDVLIHNAATFDITQKQAQYTREDVELIWATNHLGPVLLTELLMAALKNSARGRILTVSSKGLLAKPFMKIDLQDPEYRHKKFSVSNAYYQSKRAQVMYTYWLADKLRDANITANCIRVTAVKVDINKYPNISPMMKRLYALKSKSALTPEEMAETYAYLATSDEVSGVSGKCYDENRKQVKSIKYTYNEDSITQVMNLTRGYFKQNIG